MLFAYLDRIIKSNLFFFLTRVAFGVTADWVRAFDCFGGITLTGDLIISYLKTGMLLFVVGLSQDTIWVIYDSVLSQLMELCLVGSSLFFYLSHKSHHGINVALAQSVRIKLSYLYMIPLVINYKISTYGPLRESLAYD